MNTTHRIISLGVTTALLLAPAIARGQSQKAAPAARRQIGVVAHDSNTPGRIAKFTTTKSVADSNIIEDSGGRIGIGTALPTSPLTVDGIIETTSAQGGGVEWTNQPELMSRIKQRRMLSLPTADVALQNH